MCSPSLSRSPSHYVSSPYILRLAIRHPSIPPHSRFSGVKLFEEIPASGLITSELVTLGALLTLAFISLSPSTAPYLLRSRFSIEVPHSFNMSMVRNLHISLCKRCAVPTSPTLPHTSLRRHRYARIERIPLMACRTSCTTPSSSKLVVSGELKKFPSGMSDFKELRQLPGWAYFDKTKYIPELEKGAKSILLCRPSRFGKSLTVTMLRGFPVPQRV